MSEYETNINDTLEQPILLNKNGKPKKIQKNKTENRTDYMRNYMKEYIKDKPTMICELCNGKFKKYQLYIHNKGKMHTLVKQITDMKELLISQPN
jgi:hypothetical protein